MVSKGSGTNIYLFDLAVGFFALFGVISILVSNNGLRIYKNYYLFIPFTIVALVTLVSQFGVLRPLESVVATFYLVRWIIYLLAGIVVYNMLDHKIITKKAIVAAFLLSGIIISLIGYIQLVVFPDFGELDPTLGWDPHKNRLTSTFFDPNFVGGYLNLCLILVINELFSKDTKFLRLNLFFIGFILLAALFLTFSRSSWGMFALIILIFGVFKSRKLLLLALILAFLTYFTVPRVQTRLSGITDPADSAHFRLISWKNTWEIAKDNLFLGVGFNAFRYAQKDYGFLDIETVESHSGAGSDSSFLLVLATTGIIGFIIFIFAYFYPIVDSFLNRNRYSILIIASLLGLLLHSQFVNSLFYPQILYMYIIIMGFSSRT